MARPPAAVPLTASSGRVRSARRLARRAARAEERLFLAEGPQPVREALELAGCVRELFLGPDGGVEPQALAERAAAAGIAVHRVDAGALRALAGTVTPQGPVAVCAFPDAGWAALDASGRPPDLVAVCVEVRDPGNAGTVIRCADAAGADAVVLAGHSVDPYNGKAVRASAGSLFHLPVLLDSELATLVVRLRRRGLTVLAATGVGEVDLDDAGDLGLLAGPVAWLFGNEAHGLAPEVAAAADHRVRIPLHGRAESLNLASAAAVCLYATARAQR